MMYWNDLICEKKVCLDKQYEFFYLRNIPFWVHEIDLYFDIGSMILEKLEMENCQLFIDE